MVRWHNNFKLFTNYKNIMRTTKARRENQLKFIAKYIKSEGCKLAIDYYNPGDNPYSYKLVWIDNVSGGHYDFLGNEMRMTAQEFDKYLNGIITGIEMKLSN